jgi:hypothetical protein
MEMSGEFQAPPLYPRGKMYLAPIGLEAGWTQGQYGHNGDEENISIKMVRTLCYNCRKNYHISVFV